MGGWIDSTNKVGLHGLHHLWLTLPYVIDNHLIVCFYSKKHVNPLLWITQHQGWSI